MPMMRRKWFCCLPSKEVLSTFEVSPRKHNSLLSTTVMAHMTCYDKNCKCGYSWESDNSIRIFKKYTAVIAQFVKSFLTQHEGLNSYPGHLCEKLHSGTDLRQPNSQEEGVYIHMYYWNSGTCWAASIVQSVNSRFKERHCFRKQGGHLTLTYSFHLHACTYGHIWAWTRTWKRNALRECWV